MIDNCSPSRFQQFQSEYLWTVRSIFGKKSNDDRVTKNNIPQNETALRCLPKHEVSVLFLFALRWMYLTLTIPRKG